MYLKFSNKQVRDSVIERPIPVCEKVFNNTKTCGFMDEQQIKAAGSFFNWRFHNKGVYPGPRVNAIYEEDGSLP